YGREYGIRLFLIIQSLAAFKVTYGDKAVGTLMSETDIKLFLPNTREPELLSTIQDYLGEEAYINKNHNGAMGGNINGYGIHEDSRKLMSMDEIRRSKDAILFIRNHRPVKVKLPPYAAIHPWKHQVGINPFFGKKYKKRTVLRIGNRRMPIIIRIIKFITRGGV
ncbi:MAG: TraM recognition domain-containing protein, partial [Pseudomonadota bacterium]